MLPMPFAQSPLWFLLAASLMWIQPHFHKYHKCSCCTWLLWISLDRMNHRSLPSSSCRNWTIEKFQLQHPKQSLHGRRRVSGFTFSVTFSVVHCTSRCATAGAAYCASGRHTNQPRAGQHVQRLGLAFGSEDPSATGLSISLWKVQSTEVPSRSTSLFLCSLLPEAVRNQWRGTSTKLQGGFQCGSVLTWPALMRWHN